MRLSRADRSLFTDWWFTVDRVLLVAIFAAMGVSVIVSLAASPVVALKKDLPTYYFVLRHVAFSAAGAAILIAVSMLSAAGVRRLAAVLFAAALMGLLAVIFVGAEINGARRWLVAGGFSLQPSEFMKPAFVVVTAWLMAEARGRPDMPALPLAFLGLALVAGLLVAQPDIGQTLLVALVFWVLFVLSGQPMRAAAGLLAVGGGGAALAYALIDHVRSRVDRFIDPASGDTSQVDHAMRSFSHGGFLGRGPGEGTIKTLIPDAHADFIFAVIAEEYGVIACLVLLGLFAFVVLRALRRAESETDAADRLAICGLALMFGAQALINMAVNVGLLPAKGITLPFISAGGSSIIATSIGLGMLLALARRRPMRANAFTRPAPIWEGI